MSAPDRTQALHLTLLEDEDAAARARAHLELSLIALRERRTDAAVRHLREALALDAHLQQARHILAELGVGAEDRPVRKRLLQRIKARLAPRLPARLSRLWGARG